MRRILTQEQLDEARKLKEQGKSKRQISFILGIPQTTVWDNIFNNKKRIRIYKRYERPVIIRTPCARCEIMMNRNIKGMSIPLNYPIGDICLMCYLEERSINYLDLLNK